MKITEKGRTEFFYKLKNGVCFKYAGVYFIKIENALNTNHCDVLNAVNLANGDVAYFNHDTEVYPVDCELVVK